MSPKTPLGEYFVNMGPEQAAQLVIEAAQRIEKLELPQDFTGSILDNIHGAINSRHQHGLSIDPTSKEEVTGLVEAAMGGNDHLRAMQRALNRYVVGICQTDVLTFDQTRESILNGGI